MVTPLSCVDRGRAPLLGVVLARQRREQDLQQVGIALEALDLGGGRLVFGIGAHHRHLAGLQAELGGAHAQVGQQLVPGEHIPEGLHRRVGQVLPTVGSVGVGGVGEPLPRRQTDRSRKPRSHHRSAESWRSLESEENHGYARLGEEELPMRF